MLCLVKENGFCQCPEGQCTALEHVGGRRTMIDRADNVQGQVLVLTNRQETYILQFKHDGTVQGAREKKHLWKEHF